MNNRFSEELFLTNKTGSMLYHKYAENMPIIDYHCHLQPVEIAENKEFEDLGEMWLKGDHYKWRAMRTLGIHESFITGDASYHDKFLAFAAVLPELIGNPLYIWCALELKRYFDIDVPVNGENAEDIYRQTKRIIQEKHITRRWCLEHSNVELLSTTEDPVDDLRYHKQLQKENFGVKVITAFRPDKAMFAEDGGFDAYMKQLETVSGRSIQSFPDMLTALEQRLQYFKQITGTTVSDDGIPFLNWCDYAAEEIDEIFQKARKNERLTENERDKYRTAFLFEMGKMYYRNGFVMQLHIGTYLDANTKGVELAGKSCGFDCIDDSTVVSSVGELLNRLTLAGQLPRIILYPLDGTKIEAWAVLAAGFSADASGKAVRGKVQLGAPWWFNDQQYGIARQFAACANLYPVSVSVGMLTDSRSFISYPRHELYRRVLCNSFGELIERGEYFSSEEELGKVIQNICYYNVRNFFEFDQL